MTWFEAMQRLAAGALDYDDAIEVWNRAATLIDIAPDAAEPPPVSGRDRDEIALCVERGNTFSQTHIRRLVALGDWLDAWTSPPADVAVG